MAVMPGQRASSAWYRRLLESYYASRAERYDQDVIATEGEHYGNALQAGISKLQTKPERILDVHTGTGFAALLLKRIYPQAKVVGTDLSEAMLRKAREKALIEEVDVEFIQADGAQLPFGANEFDLVTIQNAPPHSPEIFRVLKPGGLLLIAFTSGALVPRFFQRKLQNQLKSIPGAHPILLETCGDGLLIVAQK